VVKDIIYYLRGVLILAKNNQQVETADSEALKWTVNLAVIAVAIIIAGFILTFAFKTFAILPFSIVIVGIVVFFGVLKISRALEPTNADTRKAEMRKAITVSIVVVYLGLLPTLTFQGIIQFQAAANTTAINVLNQTATNTIPQISLSETVVTSFTALVAAVILFYFGSRILETYFNTQKSDEENTSTTEPLDEIKKAQELLESEAITQEEYDKLKNKYLDET
jgi:putative Mn2+ efflux pump MntP